ncbi:MAG: hypothetical protein WBH84_06040 [Defluviitoga tunisiensis]|jgi:exonuclease VII small subunit|uniref:Uncharacterized protein n=1 Tax=Defluviitoga tunisiensis TaxID=1006576 RepID=A0A0C7P0R0_DEFTU|nr:hypothetical protein [Defluviitoga tunisiensis]MDD3600484.1 hypothetical protein [Defluviitoga tunisiensis]MDY0379125.1 hypothetical protein [Defluviitoga tunisiensis]CEP77614.1 hypothetical protein DTL3_0283 [Defluviitoga tunisiensis]HHV00638.1 hypothetical protein [Defluviitoga tunisiensis]HOB55281.1 hypothetical protein [Defluviitoga tunisiensis]
MEDIINLTEKDIKELSFKQQLELLERINEYFQNERDDINIEDALEIYKKALEILTYAREKLVTLKEEKSMIDEKYEKIKSQFADL